jgi:protoporphyrinogen IX oxidase
VLCGYVLRPTLAELLRNASEDRNVPEIRAAAMYEWITITAYPWIKALHVIAVISWMAGMLYLPRLFVYHCETEVGSKQSETFKVMEWRLLKVIINPAMIVTWLAGIYMAWSGHWYTSGWFHAKLTLVLILSGVHGFFSRWVKDFAADRNTRSQKFFRIINEVPTVLMIFIVILVIVKPF